VSAATVSSAIASTSPARRVIAAVAGIIRAP
jgi:hypothetical protein